MNQELTPKTKEMPKMPQGSSLELVNGVPVIIFASAPKEFLHLGGKVDYQHGAFLLLPATTPHA